MLPILSRAQDDAERFRRCYICSQNSAVAAVSMTLALIVAGEQFVTLLYGPKFAERDAQWRGWALRLSSVSLASLRRMLPPRAVIPSINFIKT